MTIFRDSVIFLFDQINPSFPATFALDQSVLAVCIEISVILKAVKYRIPKQKILNSTKFNTF